LVFAAFLACVVLSLAFPTLDLAVSALFYRPSDGFFLHDHPVVVFVYRTVPWAAAGLAVGLSSVLLSSLIFARARPWRRGTGYLLLVLVVGPGVMVNTLLKDHWGRARPHQLEQFGGARYFTPALLPADQCDRNCSFVSGHAALGFYLAAIGFVATHRRRVWLVAGLVAGTAIGLVRIVQGGHFLSDVVFSFFVVYAVAWVLQGLAQGVTDSS
jgi:lipid A 4'-phosphatase